MDWDYILAKALVIGMYSIVIAFILFLGELASAYFNKKDKDKRFAL